MSTLTTNYLTPTGREEAWRFTPLNRIAGLHDLGTAVRETLSLTAKAALPSGVTFTSVSSEDLAPVSTTNDIVVSRIRDSVATVALLQIGSEVEVAEPITLQRVDSGVQPQLSRTVIKAGAHSKSVVIIENTGSAILGEEIEIILEPGASLTFITLQEWAADAIHVGRHHAVIGRDASFTSFVVTIGGSVVRLLPTVEYAGPGSSAELNGIYFATDGQHFEHRVHVDHNIGHAKSRVNYKGALSGDKAHTVWIGDVYIHANAEGTDTYELNRNLLLSDGARADSVPNLEIETGEIVGAGHASTTGRFDDEQLFYLESRGIPAELARKLVIRGFFTEILGRLHLPEIEERLMQTIDANLESADHK
jgi:Fe-S cluster assembly protein SufD